MSTGTAHIHSSFILSAVILKAFKIKASQNLQMPRNQEIGWLGSKPLPLSHRCDLCGNEKTFAAVPVTSKLNQQSFGNVWMIQTDLRDQEEIKIKEM